MRSVLLFFLGFAFPLFAFGQMSLHNTHWLIGTSSIPVDFSTFPPQYGGIPESPTYEYAFDATVVMSTLAVSNEFGDLQFTVQYKINTTTNYPSYNQVPKVFDRDGNAFPNGNLTIQFNTIHAGAPLVVPYPNKEHQYIIIYSSSKGLYYSVVDMSLNNGSGDVDINHKDILIASPGTVFGQKMTIVPSCEDRLWLIIQSNYEKAYYSYLIDSEGVHTDFVTSLIGNFDLEIYEKSDYGFLNASHDGNYIVAGTNAGTELYEFEKCSGRLKNAQVLDTVFSRGVIFSLDNSKLYMSTFIPVHPSAITQSRLHQIGEVYQFDMNAPNLEAIQASKTIVMRNLLYEQPAMIGYHYYAGAFGQLKLGIDGKIYVAKNNEISTPSAPCSSLFLPGKEPIPLPNNQDCAYGQFLHVIHEPNELGMMCNPELDYVHLNTRIFPPETWLQNDIIPTNYLTIDSLSGGIEKEVVCFDNTMTLSAPKYAECPVWDDGSSEEERSVSESGIYWVEYYNGCIYQRDSFEVTFVPLPQVNSQYYGCADEIVLEIKSLDTFEFTYTLFNEHNNQSGQEVGAGDIVFSGLKEGVYTVHIESNGCDTTLEVELLTYPHTELSVSPEDTTILYGESLQLQASDASSYHWMPSSPLDNDTIANPLATPLEPTWFTVMAIDRYGCLDSLGLWVDIDYTMPYLIPNAFSPNGDGLNDEFKVEGLKHQKLLQFSVYNRYGEQVFFTNQTEKGWDGTYKGQPAEVGVYFYVIEFTKPNGEHEILRGDVSLLR